VKAEAQLDRFHGIYVVFEKGVDVCNELAVDGVVGRVGTGGVFRVGDDATVLGRSELEDSVNEVAEAVLLCQS
jgi:hypothetical protein